VTEEFAATPSEVVACGARLVDDAGELKGVASSLQSEGDGGGVDSCAIKPGDMGDFWNQLKWVVDTLAGTPEADADWMCGLGNDLQQAGATFQEFDQA
jgi:hypothetical protein